jgi:hypothetical protein
MRGMCERADRSQLVVANQTYSRGEFAPEYRQRRSVSPAFASQDPRPASTAAEGSRQGHFFGFAFFTADFLALLFPLPMSALAAW